MNRRGWLVGSGAVLTSVLAGCTSSDDGSNGVSDDGSETNTEDENETNNGDSSDRESSSELSADPEELLPPAPEEWSKAPTRSVADGWSGTTEGAQSYYRAPNRGMDYLVHVIRWQDAETAENFQYDPSNRWTHHVVIDDVSFASRVDGQPETDESPTLLGNAEPLTPEQVRTENKIA